MPPAPPRQPARPGRHGVPGGAMGSRSSPALWVPWGAVRHLRFGCHGEPFVTCALGAMGSRSSPALWVPWGAVRHLRFGCHGVPFVTCALGAMGSRSSPALWVPWGAVRHLRSGCQGVPFVTCALGAMAPNMQAVTTYPSSADIDNGQVRARGVEDVYGAAHARLNECTVRSNARVFLVVVVGLARVDRLRLDVGRRCGVARPLTSPAAVTAPIEVGRRHGSGRSAPRWCPGA